MVIGIVLTVIGALLTGWAHNQMDSLDYRLSQAFFDGEDNGTINIAYYAGIAMLVIGVVVFLVALTRYLSSRNNKETDNVNGNSLLSENYPYAEQSQNVQNGAGQPANVRYCVNCGNEIGLSDRFCSKCGIALRTEPSNNGYPYQ